MNGILSSTPLHLLLVDDHAMVRQGLKRILEGAELRWQVHDEGDGPAALEAARRRRFDLAVVDLSMPGMDGIELLGHLRRECPGLPVLVLSMHADEERAAHAFRAGASGYVVKDSATEELVAAARKVAAGGTHVAPAVAEHMVRHLSGHAGDPHEPVLSGREREVLRRIVAGQRVTEIAQELELSVKTVSTHKARMLEKLGLDSTAALIRYGVRHGFGAAEGA